nr:sugar transport protein 1-like [Ipomoea trifida]
MFTSSLYLAALVSSMVASYVTRKMGRQTSMMTGGFIFLVGALLNGFAQALWILIISRVLLGFGIGFANQSIPFYLLVMAPSKYKSLNIGFQLFITVGILIANQASRCLGRQPHERPDMADVLTKLELVLALQKKEVQNEVMSVDRAGRRFFFLERQHSNAHLPVVVIFMCTYVAGFAWSWGPLGWLMRSEIFPPEIRSVAQSINVSLNMIFTFAQKEVIKDYNLESPQTVILPDMRGGE